MWILLAALAPDLPGGLLRPDDFVLVALALPVALRATRTWRLQAPMRLLAVLVALLGLAVLSSLGSALAGYGLPDRLPKEVFRVFKYLTLVVVFASVQRREIMSVIRALFLATVLVVGIQLMQLRDVFDINHFMGAYYGRTDRFEELAYMVRTRGIASRPASTFVNPNVLAHFLTVSLILAAILFVGRHRYQPGHANIGPWLVAAVLLLCAVSLVLAQSRTAFAALAVAGTVVVVRTTGRGIPGSFVVMGLGLGGLVLAFAFTFDSSRLFDLLLTSGVGDSSFEQKISRLVGSIQIALGTDLWQAIIGHGPNDRFAEHADYIPADSEYGYVMLWYGILGLLTYMVLIFAMLHVARSSHGGLVLRTAVVGLVSAMLVFGFTETTLINNRVFPFFLLIIGLAHADGVAGRRDDRAAPWEAVVTAAGQGDGGGTITVRH